MIEVDTNWEKLKQEQLLPAKPPVIQVKTPVLREFATGYSLGYKCYDGVDWTQAYHMVRLDTDPSLTPAQYEFRDALQTLLVVTQAHSSPKWHTPWNAKQGKPANDYQLVRWMDTWFVLSNRGLFEQSRVSVKETYTEYGFSSKQQPLTLEEINKRLDALL